MKTRSSIVLAAVVFSASTMALIACSAETTVPDEVGSVESALSCRKGCAAWEVCSGTKCVAACSTNMTYCPSGDSGTGYCADVTNDTLNCGGCGIVCGASQTCTNGTCTASTSDAGTGEGGTGETCTNCSNGDGGTICTYLSSDPNNCGGCGIVCTSSQTCTSGTCTASISDGGTGG